jgi:Ran GTPase-activating protein (RanGAP) involved in mRNA processing and transport
VSCNLIGTAGAKAFAKNLMLEVNGTLSKLKLSSCGITDEDACIIAQALCVNNTLRVLDLSHNRFGCEGSLAIADKLNANRALKELHIDRAITRTAVNFKNEFYGYHIQIGAEAFDNNVCKRV